MNTYSKNKETEQCTIPFVMPSAFGYRFSVKSKQNSRIVGTGFFKSSRKMNKEEQIRFLHQYTNGIYFKKEAFLSIDVFEAEA
jgi:hypothetical protein